MQVTRKLPKYLDMSAVITDDRVYRYLLTRRLGTGDSRVVFIGLNPSWADGTTDDPTVRREVGFARAWGYDWYVKVNLCAFRSPDPRVLGPEKDPVGPRNWEHLQREVDRAGRVVAAWGAHQLPSQAEEISIALRSYTLFCLGECRDGSPRHPLFLPKTTELVRWR
jgi:hypothetical protein